MQRRARCGGDEARYPDDEFDAEADIEPDRRVEPEWIKRRAQERAGYGETLDDRQCQWITDQNVGAEIMKVIGHERRGGARREQCRQQEMKRLVNGMNEKRTAALRAAALGKEWIGATIALGKPRLHDGDQRRHGGEGELKAHPEDRIGLERNDGEHGK